LISRTRILGALLLLAATLTAADPPKRIVAVSPNLTEILYGIGAFGQVVGVSDYCSYPPAAAKLPSVGGWRNPDLEKLTALRPDLVILDEGQAPFLADKFKDLGLNIFIARDQSVEDIYKAMAALGRVTGHEAEATKLAQQTRDDLQRIAKKTAALPRVKVALIVDRTPGTLRDLYTATDGSYLAEIVDIAGGRIALPAVKRGYSKLSKEDLLAANPEVILDFIQGAKSRFAGDPMEAWREMPELQAVRAKRVYGVNEEFVPHASQRMVLTAELFARLIHPEAK
jgi:iron complex transport system substrate-binding protein